MSRLALLVAVTLVLATCGNSGSDTTTAASLPSDTASEAGAVEPEKTQPLATQTTETEEGSPVITELSEVVTTVPTVPVITLNPALDEDPVRVSTVIGDLEFTALHVPPGTGLTFFPVAATPYGPVVIDPEVRVHPSAADETWEVNRFTSLRWSTDYETWEGVPVPAGEWQVTAAGDDVIVHGESGATQYAWDGVRWSEAARLDLSGRIDQIVFGSRGAVAVSGSTILYSTDGVQFTQADRGPAKDLLASEESPPTSEPGDGQLAGGCPATSSGVTSKIGTVLATDAGFVALTPAHPDDWNDDPICEPLLWFSADGNTWELVSHHSPFGRTAFVRASNLETIAERDGRFVATGGVGEQGAVWVSDDGLTWQRAELDLEFAFTVAVGDLGWMLTGSAGSEDGRYQHMWFSTNGLTWDGPYDLPNGLATGWLLPQLAIGSDAIFGVGGDLIPVVGRLQDWGE
jgi:hypothetical protein